MSIRKLFLFPILILISAVSLYACTTSATRPPAVITVVVPLEVTAAPSTEPAAPTPTPVTWHVVDAGRIQFEPNTTNWHTQGDLPATTALRFTLHAERGQQMNIWLNKVNGSMPAASAVLHVAGADGSVFTLNPVVFFSQILPASQDYIIEIRSTAPAVSVYTISVEIPAAKIDPTMGDKYEPVDPAICQMIQESAAQAIGIEFFRDDLSPFLDTVAGEAGLGCHIYAVADGNQIADPWTGLTTLMSSAGGGWTEQNGYQAAGPTGFAAAMTRDMGLMLMQVDWQPTQGVDCPDDQPISACPLTPEQKVYNITIDVAQYRADFSLDGHWEDAAQNFSLDLYQDWKNIWGGHIAVAQGGAKIDTRDVSISGLLQGEVVNLQFKSGFSENVGRAQITYVDVNTIQWKIITPPEGEYYLPAEAALVR
jgi:hypothetical protein